MTDRSTISNLRTGLRLIREGRQWLGVAASGITEKPAQDGVERQIHRMADMLDRLEALAGGLERSIAEDA